MKLTPSQERRNRDESDILSLSFNRNLRHTEPELLVKDLKCERARYLLSFYLKWFNPIGSSIPRVRYDADSKIIKGKHQARARPWANYALDHKVCELPISNLLYAYARNRSAITRFDLEFYSEDFGSGRREQGPGGTNVFHHYFARQSTLIGLKS